MSPREKMPVWRQVQKMDRTSIRHEIREALLLIIIFVVCLAYMAYAALAILKVDAAWAYALVLVLTTVVGAVLGFWRHMKTLLNSGLMRNEDPAERLKRRVVAVNNAFADATTLMSELRRDLEAQQAAREQLLAEAEHQQRLLALNKDEAENIRHILVAENEATIRAARRREWGFFLAGVLVSAALSIPIGIWVNSIS